jgi:sRNA-binding protein
MSQARKQLAHAAVDALVATFPAAFDRFDRRPLKLGIAADLLARGIAADIIRAALGSYCRSPAYLRRMQAGAARIDLDGNPAGVVTAEDAEHAARKLAETAERAKQAMANQEKAAKEQAKVAARKAAEAASAPAKKAEPPSKAPAPRPAGGAVTRQPPLIVRKISRGGRSGGARR